LELEIYFLLMGRSYGAILISRYPFLLIGRYFVAKQRSCDLLIESTSHHPPLAPPILAPRHQFPNSDLGMHFSK
jgi:hypothetical protein